MMNEKHRRPLHGIRILDLTRLLPGPFATNILGDLGAEVIKVEEKGRGDYLRWSSPARFQEINRNKKSITLNLKAPAGREVFLRLCRHADVVVESFRPGVVARLGIGYEQVAHVQPQIIYCSLSGYGQTGPYAAVPGHDVNYTGVAGILSRSGHRQPLSPPIGDFSAALYTAISIMGAIMHREKTGEGQYIDLSITESALSLMSWYLADKEATSAAPRAAYGVFETKDAPITLGVIENWFWEKLCRLLQMEDLLEVEAFRTFAGRNRQAQRINQRIQDVLKTKTREEWLRLFAEADLPSAPFYDWKEVEQDPHLAARGQLLKVAENRHTVLFPAQFSKLHLAPYKPAPELGEDTETVLEEAGFTRENVEALRQQGVI